MGGVVIGVRGHAKSADDRQPPRDRSCNHPMCDFDTDPLRDRPQNPERRTPYDHSFADSNRQFAYRLRCRVLEQTIQHLFLSKSPFLAIEGGNVGGHPRLYLPDGDHFGKDGQPTQRSRRPRERTGYHRCLRGRLVCDLARSLGPQAAALSSNPEFLVCDEPTSALDVSVQAQILNLMRDLQDQFGLTYLFISHNLAVVRHMATRIGVMYLGRLVEDAPTAELFNNPRHPYTRMLLDAVPDLSMSGRPRKMIEGEIPNPISPPSGCAFHPRCPLAHDRCKAEVPKALRTDGRIAACHAVAAGLV